MQCKKKKDYFPPELDLIRFVFEDQLLLTGSVENGSSNIGENDDNGEGIEFG